jgi:hypothetical protein
VRTEQLLPRQEAEKAKELTARLKRALRKFGDHTKDCRGETCTCGFDHTVRDLLGEQS